jgi:hypothetical protein
LIDHGDSSFTGVKALVVFLPGVNARLDRQGGSKPMLIAVMGPHPPGNPWNLGAYYANCARMLKTTRIPLSTQWPYFHRPIS